MVSAGSRKNTRKYSFEKRESSDGSNMSPTESNVSANANSIHVHANTPSSVSLTSTSTIDRSFKYHSARFKSKLKSNLLTKKFRISLS